MKITKENLKQIVKEELMQVLAENKKSVKVMSAGAIRGGPGTFNKRLGTAEVGDTLKVIDDKTKENWIKIEYENAEGWISINLLKKPGKKKPGLAGLRGAQPLRNIELPIVVTGTKG
jgi:uncharacterized protein YraI